MDDISQLQHLLEETRRYGCLMLFFDKASDIGSLIYDEQDCLLDQIPEEVMTKDGRDILEGDELPHVTILYGFHEDVTPEEIKAALDEILESEDTSNNDISIKGLDFFKNEDTVIYMGVDCPLLHKLNAGFKKIFKDRYTSTYSGYTPHITVSYVDSSFDVDNLKAPEKSEYLPVEGTFVFSAADGTKHNISTI